MYYSAGAYGAKVCPYCGGMHSPGMCPLMMTPAMPPGGMYEGMGGMMPDMTGMMPGMDMMDMMMKHQKLLEEIHHYTKETYRMCKEMYLKKAKG